MNTVIEDKMFSAGKWTPKNYGKDYKGNMTLLRALETSNNVIAVKLLQKLDLIKAIKSMVRFRFWYKYIKRLYICIRYNYNYKVEMALLYTSFQMVDIKLSHILYIR